MDKKYIDEIKQRIDTMSQLLEEYQEQEKMLEILGYAHTYLHYSRVDVCGPTTEAIVTAKIRHNVDDTRRFDEIIIPNKYLKEPIEQWRRDIEQKRDALKNQVDEIKLQLGL